MKNTNKNVHNKKNALLEFVSEHQLLSLALVVYITLISIALFRQGVMCNDEALFQLYSHMGAKRFFEYFLNLQIYNKGRFLSAIPTTLCIYLGYASTNHLYVRCIAIVVLLICVLLFAYFLYKLFDKLYMSIMFIVIIWGYMPIAFEHCAPNAYVSLYSVPFAVLIFSLIVYLSYLKSGKSRFAVLSAILFFFPLCSYELFITYTPLFLMLAFYLTEENNFWKRVFLSIKKFIAPLTSALIFLVAYVITGKLFPSQYEGTQISFTIKGALKIIRQLFYSSLPGYYLFNQKYRYMFGYYAKNKTDGFFKSIFINMDIRIGLIVALFLFLFVYYWKKQKQHIASSKIENWMILLCGAVYMFLPMTPISISAMYQDNVTNTNFVELPVCYFANFAVCFCIVYILSLIDKSQIKALLAIPVTILMFLLMIGVQVMNNTISLEQENNYNRMLRIENVLDTDTFKGVNGSFVYSEDIFETRNLLAINQGYWDTYLQNQGFNISFTNDVSTSTWQLYYMDDEYFELKNNEVCYIFVPVENHRKVAYVSKGDVFTAVPLKSSNAYMDHEFVVYTVSLNN